MASNDIWILGITMTKFGKHPDKDIVDLASEAALGALGDAQVSIKDIGVLAAGNLMGGGRVGQMLQKQIGQTGIPVYNVANACATGATALRTAIMAVKAGECDLGLAVGVEKLSGAGLLGGGSRKKDEPTWTPHGRYDAVASIDGRIGTDTMPGVFAQVGMQYLYEHPYDGAQQELFAADQREEPLALDIEPARGVHEEDEPRRDHGRRDDRLPEHTPDVLGELRRCGGRRGGVRREVADARPRPAPARRQGLGVDPDQRPVGRSVPSAPRRQHAHAQRRTAGLRAVGRGARGARPRRAARLLRHRRARPLRQPHVVRTGRGRRVLRVRHHVARRRHSGERLRRSRIEGAPDRGHGHRERLGDLPSPPRRGRRPPDRRRQGRIWRTSSGSARPAVSTSSNEPPDAARDRPREPSRVDGGPGPGPPGRSHSPRRVDGGRGPRSRGDRARDRDPRRYPERPRALHVLRR